MDWKRKLTSRKFWAAIATFVSMLILAFHGKQETAAQVAEIVMAGAAIIAYIVGEGLADAAGASSQTEVFLVEDEDEDEEEPDVE